MRIDNADFAARGESASGEVALREMPRLQAALRDANAALGGGAGATHSGEEKIRYTVCGGKSGARLWLKITLRGMLPLTCCRCGEELDFEINDARRFILVAKDGEAGDGEEEIAIDAAMDVGDFVEDELIMAVPIAPRHRECPPSAAA
jgi:uncharacterized protein